MSKKNKGHDKPSTSTESGTSVTSASKPRALRKPRGTLLEQFANKADKVYSMVSEISKELMTRGAPKETCEAATAFLVQVEGWREKIFGLKSSGWEPVSKGVKVPIVEGDPIKIADEHLSRYSFIEGLAEGKVLLVAGSVVEVSRFQVDVMLKDTEGKFYGYAPRKFLAHR